MDHPIQHLCGHLLFSRDGTVWATWRLQGQAYGRRAVWEKERIRVLHQMLYRSLGGESLHLGLEVDTDPVAVVQAMLRGLSQPLAALPEWASEVEATLDRLETDLVLSERTYWLSVPLRNTGASVLTEAARSALTSLLSQVGAPRRAPAVPVLAERLQQAAEIQAVIPGPFQARPASSAELVWIYRHAQLRGLAGEAVGEEVWLPETPQTSQIEQFLSLGTGSTDVEDGEDDGHDGNDVAPVAHLQSPGRIGCPILDEAAVTDIPAQPGRGSLRARLRRLLPSQRTVLKITDTEDQAASYQSLAVLAGTPTAGALFPGTEWLGMAEQAGVPVDWAVRMRNNARENVLIRNQRAVKNLNDQYEQREGEVTTGSHELDAVAAALTEYQARLANEKLEVELETITVLATSAGTREQALANGAQLVRHYNEFDHRLLRPLGQQHQAWWAMLPGTGWPTAFNDLAQICLAEGFSAAVPMVSSQLGDGQGALWALNETTQAASPVLIDLFTTILANFSAAIAIAGELGSGKSYSLKSLAGAMVDRGARLVTIDRSQTAEYVSFARSLGGCTLAAVVDNPDAGVQLEYSLDPLRLFPGRDGARITQTLLTPLLAIDANSDVDLALTHTTAPDYRAAHRIDSLADLSQHLLSGACTVVGAGELGRKLRALQTKDYARVLFDQTLPALNLHATRALVFTTYGLQLPSREELLNEHLFKRLSPHKHFGRAMYALLMALARSLAFANPDELVFFVSDECHHITASIEGEEELTTFIREGRKNGAAAGLGSQDCANDFGNETLRGLIPYRLVMRLTDENLAHKALEWIGLEDTPEHLEEITTGLSPRDLNNPDGQVAPERRGEGLFRDSYCRLGRVRILGPALPSRRVAYSTTPKRATSLHQPTAPGQPPAFPPSPTASPAPAAPAASATSLTVGPTRPAGTAPVTQASTAPTMSAPPTSGTGAATPSRSRTASAVPDQVTSSSTGTSTGPSPVSEAGTVERYVEAPGAGAAAKAAGKPVSTLPVSRRRPTPSSGPTSAPSCTATRSARSTSGPVQDVGEAGSRA
ncbi:ATP-binding protein [Kineococcus sp. SYSU DK003]|uniref:ATP-binding protein n=1 Tax=Kineococcus sp. SYSU DK003 TaxID=3383124 RepID=UPI003D7CD741